MSENKKKIKVPHIFIILSFMMLLMVVLTYIIPAGTFERTLDPATGRQIVDPLSFHYVDRNPASLLDFFVAMPQGFVEAGWIVVLTFCVGGGFTIVKKTGVINESITALSEKLSNKGIVIIPILMTVFAAIDCFIGMPELCMVYVPIILPLMLALGFDSVTACATALCGSAVGFTCAIANPFTVVVGDKITGLPLYSGWEYRLVILLIVLVVTIVYVMRYAKKVNQKPTSSLMYERDLQTKEELKDEAEVKGHMTGKQKAGGLAAVALFILMVFGVFNWGWDMPEIGGIFIAIGVASGLINRMSGEEICDAFMEGCHDVLLGALVIGLARGISVIMGGAMIQDTIVYGLSKVVSALPSSLSAVGMMVLQTLVNFLIPSGSGQTVVMMPIMAPLADMIGVTRQSALLALQFGDGFSNVFYPVSGYMMATIGLAHVDYNKWAKFIFPLFLIWTAMAAVFMVIAQAIQFGPF